MIKHRSNREQTLERVQKKRKSNADCSEQCLSMASEPNIKEKRSRRSDHDPTTIENCLLCQKTKALRKDGRTSGYESLAELQTFEASKTLIDAAEIHNDARVLLAIKDQDLIALEVKYHKSCYRDYRNAKTLDRIKVKNEQESKKKGTKVKGGILGFSTSQNTVQRWMLIAHERASNQL